MRFVAGIVVGLVTNAVALLVASLLLDGFDIDALAFPIVVIVFSLVGAVVQPFLESFVQRNVQAVAGVVGLLVTFVTLLVTEVLSVGLDVSGVSAWVLGTLILWAAALITGILVGKRIFNRIAGERPA
jgi:uncharacterized membrane protein YvlD (DUF360 family)